MAGNFNISITRAGGHVHMKLKGDFDGSSACELVNLLSNSDLRTDSKIMVNTDALRRIHPFGVDVFKRWLSAATAGRLPLTFTGKRSTQFALK